MKNTEATGAAIRGMNALILYSSRKGLTANHQPIGVPGGKDIYIRVEHVTDVDDLSEALDRARPMSGEVLLNSIEAT